MPSFTGHPLVDVGLATITGFAGKARPEDLVEADSDAIADYMARNYVVNPPSPSPRSPFRLVILHSQLIGKGQETTQWPCQS